MTTRVQERPCQICGEPMLRYKFCDRCVKLVAKQNWKLRSAGFPKSSKQAAENVRGILGLPLIGKI